MELDEEDRQVLRYLRKTALIFFIAFLWFGTMMILWAQVVNTSAQSNPENTTIVLKAQVLTPTAQAKVKLTKVAKTKACKMDSRFPASILQWCPEITEASTKYGVPANLIGSVMVQESGGDPNSISSAGAVGLLQFMPSDAPGYGDMFASRPTTAELLEPAFNIDAGTSELAGLYKRYGDWPMALYHYGGTGYGDVYWTKVMKWWDLYGGGK
jgi:soluble lytic murein transglycosylase-like protein